TEATVNCLFILLLLPYPAPLSTVATEFLEYRYQQGRIFAEFGPRDDWLILIEHGQMREGWSHVTAYCV
uniref:MHC class I antigen n=1 Tax=Romanomermis culicivorax TaxID=13658 RepID=A0A915I669_ROMCU